MKKNVTTWRRYIFSAVWVLTTAIFGWQLLEREHTFDSPRMWFNLLMLLICAIALIWWLSCPLRDGSSNVARTKWGRFILFVAIAVYAPFALRTVVGPPLLFGLPAVAVAVLAFLRPKITRQETLYAMGLSLVAGVAGLGAGWAPFHPVVWSVLQVLLVSTSFLAGWAVLRRAGLLDQGIGYSRFLPEGTASALRGFLQGMLIGLPWALSIVVMGGSDSETWVRRWWQPLVAINPGIAEEAWGRILPVPLLFSLLCRVSRPRKAFIAALVIVGYWFAYLHTPSGMGELFSTIMIGTLYVLPVSYICLHRDLETAIGFHFWLDFVKFAAAYLLNTGLWLTS
ncbi:MAG: hypothetical protein ACE5E7_03170 [Anaerolineae bacterium]